FNSLMISFLLLLFSSVIAERHYDRLYNELSQSIANAKIKGEENIEISKELYYESEWKRDLAPFQSGITREMMGQLESLGNKYQIINHTVYRAKRCTFPARCQGVDKFLTRLAHRLEDTEFVLNDFDNPKLTKRARPLPLFSFSKKEDDYWDILYPAWSFHSGGPAISIYPSGIGNWSETKEELSKYSSSHPWSTRESRGFFIGSRTNHQRDSLVLLSRRFPSLVDASFTKNQAYRSPQDTLNAEPSTERPFEYNCNYKYLFNFRGIAASFRFKYLLACGSTVFHLDDGWIEFFYRKLIPYYHYIPLKERENNQKGLKTLLEYAIEHDEEMKKIGDNAHSWISSHLDESSIDLYWIGLLSSYSSLLKFPIERDVSLMKVSNEGSISSQFP
ncbi:hypothetical protein PRIPAC_80040, partial [Pristionchus pacificus]|uniref:Glycosyl transferase CAP10 domain-containing protein n=1 Tax=Pristionchus pacificus TaxID=54126 RepID=A0A8R1V2P4_PRIPA